MCEHVHVSPGDLRGQRICGAEIVNEPSDVGAFLLFFETGFHTIAQTDFKLISEG